MKKMKILIMALAVLSYIGATSVYAQTTRATSTTQKESRGIEHEDIGITGTGKEKRRGRTEGQWRVEKGERSTGNESPGDVSFGDGKKSRTPEKATKKKERDVKP